MTDKPVKPYTYEVPTPTQFRAIREALEIRGLTEAWLGRQMTSRWYPKGLSRAYIHAVLAGDVMYPDPRRFTVARAWRVINMTLGPMPKAARGEHKALATSDRRRAMQTRRKGVK